MSEQNPTQPPSWNRIADTFDRLSQLPPADRTDQLKDLQDQDPMLAKEVASLLRSLEDRPDFLEQPARYDGVDAEPGIPDRIGHYKVLGRIGQGGMGVVYKAVRDDGSLDHEVAIKMVHAQPGEAMALQRFERERQILARLDHPGIARPLDAGKVDANTLYLVMDYVDGLPIDVYCREHELGVNDRLRLVADLCEAVDYAHRSLVIHRDIKPANVLVDSNGRPRLLDFGISRLLDTSDDVGITQTGLYAMTPAYASPEQFTEAALTTASDIYALGAVAYLLLCHRPPLDLSELSMDSILQRVRNESPQPPSEALGSGISRDTDAIVLKALRKEPERRYASAAEMAADIHRLLDGRPVLAQPDTLGYRFAKFARRHRYAVAGGAASIIALVCLTAVAFWQAQNATSARDRAQLEAERSETVLGFFQTMLASANPAQAQGNETTVRELLDSTRDGLGSADLDPLALATVEETLATTYLSLGLPDSGQELAQSASERLRMALGPKHPRTLAAQHAEARFYIYGGDYQRAIDILEPTLAGRRDVLGEHIDTVNTLHNLAMAYAMKGEVEKALEMDKQQLRIVERLSGKGSPDALTTMISIGQGYSELGRHTEALDIFRQVYEGQKEYLGDRHPTTMSALNNYAVLSRRAGDIDGARTRYEEVVRLRREVLGNEHAQTLNSINNLGEFYLHQERPEKALPLITEALETRRTALGELHPDTLSSRVALARLYRLQGDFERAASEAKDVLALAVQHHGEDSAPARQAADLQQDSRSVNRTRRRHHQIHSLLDGLGRKIERVRDRRFTQ